MQVLVKHEDIYYRCVMLSYIKIKCGKCLFGLIDPFQEPYAYQCKRCGAKVAKVLYKQPPYRQYIDEYEFNY